VLDLQQNGCGSIETDIGLAAAGLVRVALNYRLDAATWERIAADSGVRAIIYDARFADAAEQLLASLDHAVVVGDGPGIAYESLLTSAARLPERWYQPEAVVSLNYSSGTTGAPKGVQRTHRNRLASCAAMLFDVLGGRPAPDDVWCHAGPLTHASGLFVLPHLVSGTRQIILSDWSPDGFVEAVAERGATGSVLVPTMIARLLASGVTSAGEARRLRRLVYAGAPMPPEQIREAADRITPHLVQFYGLVEAMPPVSVLDEADHERGFGDAPTLLTSAGRPALGVGVRVVDESGCVVPDGDIGEVITSGDNVMRGYWRAGEDAAKSVRDGWLHTGDLGFTDDEGRLYLVDRKGDMIITGGYNVYPREVEDVIAEVPGVREVAVVGVRDPDWGQRIVAVYTGEPLDDAIRTWCEASLASFKKPKQVIRVHSLPLSSTGKIARRVLRDQLEAESTS
jgi:acyl-CoA synthetase (AMP-forming)/AMP-acid ligase II